jgi:hypothetical protein
MKVVMPRTKRLSTNSYVDRELPTIAQFEQTVQTVTDAYWRAVLDAQRIGQAREWQAKAASQGDLRYARLANLADALLELATMGRVSRPLSEFEREILRTLAADLRRQ